MTSKTRHARRAADKDTALAVFTARKAQIDALLARIQKASDDHFGAMPEEINWGHAGSAYEVLTNLQRIAEFLGLPQD